MRHERIVPKNLLALAALLFCMPTVLAQSKQPVPVARLLDDWTARSWTVAEGLPENAVRGLAFGPDGFLWLVTPRHLCRFDGVNFKDLGVTELPGASEEMRLQGLHFDSKGRCWVYGSEGVWFFESNAWTQVPLRGKGPLEVRAVAESREGIFWFLAASGLYRWDKESLDWYPLPKQDPSCVLLYDLTLDQEGTPWIAAADRVFRFDKKTFQPVALPDDSAFKRSVYNIAFGAFSHRVWVASYRHVFAHTPEGWMQPECPPRGDSFIPPGILLERGPDDLWVGGERGLYRLSEGRWSYAYSEGMTFPINCHALCADAEGNVWVGAEGGLLRFTARVARSVTFDGFEKGPGRVLGLHVTDEKVWAGLLDGGVFVGNQQGLIPASGADRISRYAVKAVLPGDGSMLWAGTLGHGACWFNKAGAGPHTLIYWGGHYKPDLALTVDALLLDRDKTLWIGATDGLFKCTNATEDFGVKHGFGPASAVNSLYEDADGSLWCGYEEQGLWHRMPDGTTEHFTEQDGLPGRGVFAICRDAEGVLWLGGYKGLARWEGKNQKAERGMQPQHGRHVFGKANGLEPPVLQLVPDGQGRLWLGTPSGIWVLSRQELAHLAARPQTKLLTARWIARDEGMKNPECTGGFSFSGAAPPHRRLWFATADGVSVIDPGSVSHETRVPSVFIEGLWVDGKPYWQPEVFPPQRKAGKTEVITLPAGAMRLSIHFSGLDYSAPNRIRFRYRLDSKGTANESGSGWSILSRQREVNFEWLPDGFHAIEVQACSASGGWSTQTETLRFHIAPHFWQTGWFAFAVFATTAMAAGAVVRYRQWRKYRRQLAELQHQRALQQERERIARDIHDEIGSSLTHVACMSDLAQKKTEPGSDIRGRLVKIYQAASELTRQIDEIVWAVNPANDSAARCLPFIAQAAETFLRNAEVGVAVEWPEPLPEITIPPAVRHHLFLAMREALGNIVKHAGATSVRIGFEITPNRLKLVIRDDGRGFAPDAAAGPEEGHDGLANMRKRMEKVGGCMELQSAPGRGTVIRFDVPLLTKDDEP